MRIKLRKSSREHLFARLLFVTNEVEKLVKELKVSPRTLLDWKRGAYTIPIRAFNIMVHKAGIRINELSFTELADTWHIQRAARKGGLARTAFSNPGTPRGRRLGGIRSLKTHRTQQTGFCILKLVKKPKRTKDLAELLGVLFGDGHLSRYQIQVTTNSNTDLDHAGYVAGLFRRLCGVTVNLKKHTHQNVVTVTVSSKRLVSIFNRLGMPIGNKIVNGMSVPAWIKKSQVYQRAFLRGLFDTDGCIYLDTHRAGKKIYCHLGWTITSYADRLMKDVLEMLRSLGFRPTNRKTQRSAFMRRQQDIDRYFKFVGTHNPKHVRRYQKFKKRRHHASNTPAARRGVLNGKALVSKTRAP